MMTAFQRCFYRALRSIRSQHIHGGDNGDSNLIFGEISPKSLAKESPGKVCDAGRSQHKICMVILTPSELYFRKVEGNPCKGVQGRKGNTITEDGDKDHSGRGGSRRRYSRTKRTGYRTQNLTN